ncbi:hypothetical protein QTO34_017307 [Cnephaeus nilssonii]|uniref:Uncharacterized protein n=1 Tax=Cnephaeus nilssonii TaxID=3371016 RepID=A0AA40I1J9_CNENI|nr:hypothetical protein QTO34_017307 [Eptesicus nilssonii]
MALALLVPSAGASPSRSVPSVDVNGASAVSVWEWQWWWKRGCQQTGPGAMMSDIVNLMWVLDKILEARCAKFVHVIYEQEGVYIHSSCGKSNDQDSLISGILRVLEKVLTEDLRLRPSPRHRARGPQAAPPAWRGLTGDLKGPQAASPVPVPGNLRPRPPPGGA